MTDLTPPEHEHSEAVIQAAQWLADQPVPPTPLVPTLQQRFGLTLIEATEACALATRYRMLRSAMA